jgi:hypothetical protein
MRENLRPYEGRPHRIPEYGKGPKSTPQCITVASRGAAAYHRGELIEQRRKMLTAYATFIRREKRRRGR